MSVMCYHSFFFQHLLTDRVALLGHEESVNTEKTSFPSGHPILPEDMGELYCDIHVFSEFTVATDIADLSAAQLYEMNQVRHINLS